MYTNIRVRVETREKLRELGKKGETYDEIINRLIKMCGERNERNVQ